MDWKRFTEIALLGSTDLQQHAILLIRVSLGLFFTISGARKFWVATNKQAMCETLVAAKVPLPRLMTSANGKIIEVNNVVETVLYVAQAEQVTGEVLHVDGVEHAGHWQP